MEKMLKESLDNYTHIGLVDERKFSCDTNQAFSSLFLSEQDQSDQTMARQTELN